MESGAIISECEKYRYLLWRTWHDDKRKLLYVMLNPSTAAHTNIDPTIKRCIKFAASHGYGGIIVANLFAYRSTDPSQLPTDDAAIGPDNDATLLRLSTQLDLDVCFAWGTEKRIGKRSEQVISMFPGAMCLEKTKYGHPKHPLFIKGDVRLTLFTH